MRLDETIPDLEVFLAMQPAELAPHVLRAAATLPGHPVQAFTLQQIIEPPGGMGGTLRLYRGTQSAQVERAVREAIQWLATEVLIMPREAAWYDVTRNGAALLDQAKFEAYVEASSFPKSLLHPSIAEKVWLALARGDLEDAVFFSFKSVEVAVRAAAGYGPESLGVKMMRDAFNPNGGPLTRGATTGERESLAALFAGAIGSYKNPHSHRTVTITDRTEAQEMVMLASHLLRIVDSFKF